MIESTSKDVYDVYNSFFCAKARPRWWYYLVRWYRFLFRNMAAKRNISRFYNWYAEQRSGRISIFLNQGYAPLEPDESLPELLDEDRPFRFSMYLYYHVASQVELRNKEVLEVSCGRGGGSYFLMKYMHPKRIVGIDLSAKNIELNAKTFHLAGLSFCQGDAEALPFASGSFDVVVNIESHHLYPNPKKFYHEVERVLRPNGYFLYSDLGKKGHMEEVRMQLKKIGFVVLNSKDITKNVVENIRRRNGDMERILRSVAKDEKRYCQLASWAKMVGTEGYKAYCEGIDEYCSCIFRKR